MPPARGEIVDSQLFLLSICSNGPVNQPSQNLAVISSTSRKVDENRVELVMRREEKCEIFNYIINSMILFRKCKISA